MFVPPPELFIRGKTGLACDKDRNIDVVAFLNLGVISGDVSDEAHPIFADGAVRAFCETAEAILALI